MHAGKSSDDDEFVKYFNQPPDREFTWVNCDDFSVLLIHGCIEEFSGNERQIINKMREKLNKILSGIELKWFEQIIILYHHPNITFSENEFLIDKKEIKQSFSSMTNYIEGALGKISCIGEDLKKRFIGLIPQLKLQKIAIIKHRLMHLFLPIDLDIQGLIDIGFSKEYISEVIKTYKEITDPFEEARKIIYKNMLSTQDESLESVIKNDLSKKGVEAAWNNIKDKLPERKGGDFWRIEEFCQKIRSGDLDKSEIFKINAENFHNWYLDFEKVINELERALRSERE